MNIVLIGYRGTGKSTVARLLASRLERELVSTDAEIVKRAQRTIPEIVAQDGWEHFRDLESEICREIAGRDQLIIDTGGGGHTSRTEYRGVEEEWDRILADGLCRDDCETNWH
jgi:shikimate kinase